MTKRILLAIVLLGSWNCLVRAETFSLGLDVKSAELQKKTPVLIYIANDLFPVVRSPKIFQSLQFLMKALKGERVDRYGLPGEPSLQLVNGERMLAKHYPAVSAEELAAFQKLPEQDREFLKQVAKIVEEDASEDFTGIEDRSLISHIVRKNPKYRLDYVSLRNFTMPFEMQRGGIYAKFRWYHTLHRNTECQLISEDTDFAKLPDEVFEFPYSDQPLSHPAVIKLLLERVYELFPPAKHRFILVVKSQGAPGYALTPRHDIFTTDLGLPKTASALLDRRQEILGKGSNLEADRGTMRRISDALHTGAGTKQGAIKGTRLVELLDILGRGPGEFPLVLLDVNNLEPSPDVLKSRKDRNIGDVVYSNRSLPHATLDYNDVFSFLGVPPQDFETRLRGYLKENWR